MEKNVSGQKWRVFAFNPTTGLPVTGDAANITAQLKIDAAVLESVDDTNPAEIANGYYDFDILQAESNGDNILILPVSATADVQVVGVPGVYTTTAPNANALSIEASGEITGLSAAGIDAILDETIGDGTITMRQALRVSVASFASKVSGGGTTTITYRNNADTQDVIIMTVDSNGNRTAITLTP